MKAIHVASSYEWEICNLYVSYNIIHNGGEAKKRRKLEIRTVHTLHLIILRSFMFRAVSRPQLSVGNVSFSFQILRASLEL